MASNHQKTVPLVLELSFSSARTQLEAVANAGSPFGFGTSASACVHAGFDGMDARSIAPAKSEESKHQHEVQLHLMCRKACSVVTLHRGLQGAVRLLLVRAARDATAQLSVGEKSEITV